MNDQDPVALALELNRRRDAQRYAWMHIKAKLDALPVEHHRYTGMNWGACRARVLALVMR